MATVRYIVDDVAEAVDFYVSKLGFKVELQVPAFASLTRDDLTLWLGGPRSSAARPMLDGAVPSAGGWARFVLTVDDLESLVAGLNGAVKFDKYRHDMDHSGGLTPQDLLRWIDVNNGVSKSSRARRIASSMRFSSMALPIWTACANSSAWVSVSSAELNVAPWIPSRPVRPPRATMRSPMLGSPAIRWRGMVPMHPTKTSGLPT